MTSPPIKNPKETELAGGISEGSGRNEHTKRVTRYGKAHSRSLEMLAHIRKEIKTPVPVCPSPQLVKIASAMQDCGNYLVFRNYFTVGQIKLSKASFCKKHQLCPLCAIRRGAKQLKAYVDKTDIVKLQNPTIRASLLTLTVKNGPDLEERFMHLQKAVKTLLARRRKSLSKGHRHKTEFTKILGAVGTYEITNKGNGWHPHTHLIVLHDENIDSAVLTDEWRRITGDSFIIDIRPVHNPNNLASDFVEVFKYSVKFSDLSLADNLYAFSRLQGKRMIYSFGLLWGVKVPDDLTDDQLKDLPYIELFYKYFNGEYRLSASAEPKIDLPQITHDSKTCA
jgi:plasmid rolling circle replication initiator protein Rep